MAEPGETGSAAKTILTPEEMLREEAQAVHGDAAAIVAGKGGAELYQALNQLNSAALCLSGGGIRSAAFGLGVLQALAVHPRPAAPRDAPPENLRAQPESSLLARLHYISTVSGGGYIGSWLTAGIARTSFGEMWHRLVERRPRPEDEAAQIAWLRAYSNYLTPKLGLTSADTWTAIALYIRNLILNWLVVLPVLCAALIAIKLAIAAAFQLTFGGPLWVMGLGLIGAVALIWALRFALLHRPTRPLRGRHGPDALRHGRRAGQTDAKGTPSTNERTQASGRGADQGKFLRYDLFPALIATIAFSFLFLPRAMTDVLEWDLWMLPLAGAILGAPLYAVAWLVAWPWPKSTKERNARYWAGDFWRWSVAGAVYGAIIGLGAHLMGYDLSILVGNIKVTDPTLNVLLYFIYGVPWIITAQLTAEMIFVGLTSLQIDSDADREWFGRSTGWYTAIAIAWLLVTFLVLVGSALAFDLYTIAGSVFGQTAGGVVSIVAGVATAVLGKSAASPASNEAPNRSSWTGWALAITTPIFVAALVVGFSALLDALLLGTPFLQSPLVGGPVQAVVMSPTGVPTLVEPPTDPDEAPSAARDLMWLLIGLAISLAVAWIASKNVNVNRFSLHALYRNRIIRAFLGATNPERNPDSFTGFDERDNPSMRQLWPANSPGRLFHVINIALNVVSSQRLAWQERKAESFTVSPLHSGSAYKAYRRSGEYARGTEHGDGISVGTAVAISGAAASPNMGYHSSPMVTILLALFNVRLGWWLGNPGKEGEQTYTTEGPSMAVKPLFDEMFGQTTDQNPYVYLSDGGHFENLGLYEMVRRRCRFIIVSDAGCDKAFHFEDLGNAVRKIWLDLGVPITFRGLNTLRFRAEEAAYAEYMPPFHAVGTIDYPSADGPGGKKGIILYIKPCFHRNRIENVGVRNYATLNADFPHQSTSDQFFSESQFESYRALGFEMADDILKQVLASSNLPADAKLDQIFDLIPQTAAPGP